MAVVVDLSEVTVGELATRLPAVAPSPQQLTAAVTSAIVDTLVLRELAVLGIHPRNGESKAAAAKRLLAEVYAPERHCAAVSQSDLRLAYMQQLSRYKHPASWTLWSAIAATEADAQRLADALRKHLPSPPTLPASATCTGPGGPVAESHAKPFEEQVAALPDPATALQLRRYTFYDQRDPAIPAGHFRATDPNVAAEVASLRIGQWTGPIKAQDGYHVALVTCRDRRRFDALTAPSVQAELKRLLCSSAAEMARNDHVERLLNGATITYRRGVLRRAFGERSLAKLPPDSRDKPRPQLPE